MICFGVGFSPLLMRSVEPMTARWAMRRCRDADRQDSVAVLSVVDTRPWRRADSKPSVRVGDRSHEESNPLK